MMPGPVTSESGPDRGLTGIMMVSVKVMVIMLIKRVKATGMTRIRRRRSQAADTASASEVSLWARNRAPPT
eukprot:1721733-Rhodomonas_salina.1